MYVRLLDAWIRQMHGYGRCMDTVEDVKMGVGRCMEMR
ncbi:MAG: hypothetical protein BSOLF_1043 [Candidatus Carbobacillus altaicus]|uniref:Uncharacterized protein n=1 Tax=Candidatus Carbonibacillus altaicus TaxID=2163959 RepID=A0A2R6XZZ9_9BACL|nr:MAG: hypothetical protein BSOLF_1043 [Candidatus Carbobacillus altaicus]